MTHCIERTRKETTVITVSYRVERICNALLPFIFYWRYFNAIMFDALNLASLQPPKYHPPKSRLVDLFGVKVLFHSISDGGRYLTEDDLEPFRMEGDPLVDEIFVLLRKEQRPIRPYDDLLSMARAAHDNIDIKKAEPSIADDKMSKFVEKYSKLPDWVDTQQLERGQRVYLAYTPAMSMSLYYRSLVPGFSLPKIAAVLQATGYLTPPSSRESVMNRLSDTAGMVLACMLSMGSLLPGGKGWEACLHVRFLHAKVRDRLMRNTRWDLKKNGIPINQEDMAATLLAFSHNSLLGVEIALGRPLSETERLDYTALWRYIGWLLGVHVNETHQERNIDPLGPGWDKSRPDPLEHSKAVFSSILLHLMKPDDSSIKIAHHLLHIGLSSEKLSKRDDDWFYFRAARCRQLIGDPLADALKLPYHPTWLGRLRMGVFMSIYSVVIFIYTIGSLPWSPFRFLVVEFHRNRIERFFQNWETTHSKRMSKTFKKAKSSCPFGFLSGMVESDLS